MSDAASTVRKSGIDPVKLATMMNTVYLLTDVMERKSYAIEELFSRVGAFKFKEKKNVLAIRDNAKQLVRSVTKTLEGSNMEESFGDLADETYDLIDAFLAVKNTKDRLSIIDHIKTHYHHGENS